MTSDVAVTIVVPTHNRVTALMRLLRALERQMPVDGGFEVVVVDDGSMDGTAAAVAEVDWSFPLIVHTQAPSGPAAARNAGAARASGEVLLFLDDDVEPMSDVVRLHAMFHQGYENCVAIGDLQPIVAAAGYLGTLLRGLWQTMYEGPRQPGHRAQYRDLISAHFSMPRASFEVLGGFNPLLRSREDWELGYRAIAAGLRLQFLPDAVALHYEGATLTKLLKRRFDDGAADVRLIQWYPALVSSLLLGCPGKRGKLTRSLRRLAWTSPVIGDCVARALRVPLRIFEMARLRFRWRAVLEKLLDYSYWRGVAAASGNPDRLRALSDREPRWQVPDMTLDLGDGIEAAKTRVDAVRPASVRLMFAGVFIGDVDAESGAERLRGEHLPKLLVERFALEYIRAASQPGAVPWNLLGTVSGSRNSVRNPRHANAANLDAPTVQRTGPAAEPLPRSSAPAAIRVAGPGAMRVHIVRTGYAHWGRYSGMNQFIPYLDPERFDVSEDLAPEDGFNGPTPRSALRRWVCHRVQQKGMPWYSPTDFGAEVGTALRCCGIRRPHLIHYLDGEHSARFLPRWTRAWKLCPNIATYHQPPEVLVNVIRRDVVNAMDRITVVSPEQAEFFAGFVPTVRIHLTPIGVDTDFFTPGPDHAARDRFRCLTVGHNYRDFGALRATAKLLQDDPAIEFHVVCPRATGLEDLPNVRCFTDLSDAELLAAYQQSDLLFIPLLKITANLAVLEAMATGLPVLSTGLPAMKQYVNDQCATLISGNPPGDFADTIRDLSRRRALARTMGRAARLKAEEFGWRQIGALFANIYAEVA